MIDTAVLVVGAGPVGMAMALVLDRFGIPHVVVERSLGTTDHPKAHGCMVRTMEHFRVWGLEDAVRAGGLSPQATGVWFCESVTGHVFGVPRARVSAQSPTSVCAVTQDVVEDVLDGSLRKNGHTTLRRGCELVDLTQDDLGVTATVRDLATGEDVGIRADYLIACDGAGSRIRRKLGIELEGHEAMARVANYYYRAEVGHLPQVHEAFAFSVWPTDPDVRPGWVTFAGNAGDRWIFTQPVSDMDHPDEEVPVLSEDELLPTLRAHWGIPDLDIELLNVKLWRISAQLPTALRSGRVILAGDAAHLIPPSGGLGMNSGFQDVHNLGWKLALVVGGVAPDALLDTYEAERRPVVAGIIEWSKANGHRMWKMPEVIRRRHEDPEAWRELLLDFENHMDSVGQQLGYVYERGALVDDGTAVPAMDPQNYWPTDRPGARFPHMWVDRSLSESTIDWFDAEFVLVCGPDAHEWRAAGERVAGESPVPLRVRTLPTVAGPIAFGATGAVLVRPDGHVAWRPSEMPDDPTAALAEALAHIVAGGTEAPDGD